MNATRIYRTLLCLYPADYRARFAREMQDSFRCAAGEHRLIGGIARIRFLGGEFMGLVIGAGAEWIAKWTTSVAIRGRCLPDLRMMRPPGVPREVWFAGASLNSGGCEKGTCSRDTSL